MRRVRPEPAALDATALLQNLLAMLAVAAIASVVFLTALGRVALWDRDEPEYAQAAREMQQRGDWLIPTLQGVPQLDKPILIYWVLRAGYLALGVNEFSARVPSAVFGVLTCLLTYQLGLALWSAEIGLTAAIIVATSALVVASHRLVLTDPFLVFFTTLSLLLYARSLRRCGREGIWLTLSYVSLGFAVLSKGPIGFFPTGVFFLNEWLTGDQPAVSRARAIFGRHLPRLLVASVIAVPWFLYALVVESHAATAFFTVENLARFFRPFEGHSGSIFYYVAVVAIGCLPWTPVLVLWLCKDFSLRPSGDSARLLLTLWVSVVFVFFSLGATKLPHYILPAFPALACLLAKTWLHRVLPERNFLQAALVATALLAFATVIAPGVLSFVRPQYASVQLSVPPLIVGTLLIVAAGKVRTQCPRQAFWVVTLGSVLLYVWLGTVTLPWIDRFRVMKPIALKLGEAPCRDATVYALGIRAPSLVFYSNRPVAMLDSVAVRAVLLEARPVCLIARSGDLETIPLKGLYSVVVRRQGFAENGGEITLVLVSNSAAMEPAARAEFDRGDRDR
jgi:4-amino-4-deoxy-L-arabinose transferase-like glycosyltransferase